jgi:NADPH-dependent glutamate synthase beta subunit-like oxidoreductase
VARTARRLGAEPVIVYRRSREQMPAHDFEINEALEEGVVVNWLRTITESDEQGFRIEKMALDENGWPQPTGEFETIEADSLVLALGQNVDQGILTSLPGVSLNADGVVEVGADMATAYAGVFAGGDMVPAQRTVTVAVGHGKKAARHIDAYLRAACYVPAPKSELASFEMLNTWYYSDAEQTVQPVLDAARRSSNFDEVHTGLDAGNALFEARRCLSCGNCFECDNCYGICPDNAITKLGPGRRFEFRYDYCKGCGMCASECPCGAILMQPEAT